MSADNQAAAQEPAAAGAAMASASSEYLKRTCLICGCHTNQTINIYEPRSGPNIVQLIQAKFKFQPLNEDKYLCFSCNNWLINWHSLQAMNSNDADNQSPSHMSSNGSLLREEEKAAAAAAAGKLRPVAQVRPWQVQSEPTSANSHPHPPQSTAPLSYGKRSFRFNSLRLTQFRQRKILLHCTGCHEPIVLRSSARAVGAQSLAKLKLRRQAQCRKCREISKWRRLHLRSIAKVAQLQRALATQRRQRCGSRRGQPMAVATDQPAVAVLPPALTHQRYQRPSVDGKVVAMFRRLGTTLSRESPAVREEAEEEKERQPERPMIMSPAKQRPRWTRRLESDEILLQFDSAISEVLPKAASTTARRRLCYQLTEQREHGNEKPARNTHQTETEVPKLALQDFRLPQGLSITLV